MKEILQLKFTDEEIGYIRKDFDPEAYRQIDNWDDMPKEEAKQKRLLNKIRAKPVKDVLMKKYRGAVLALETTLNEPIMSAVIMVGNDPASQIYTEYMIKICYESGIQPIVFRLREEDGQTQLLRLLDFVNKTQGIHGIILQNPLPSGDPADPFDRLEAFTLLPEFKDIDCANVANVARFHMSGNPDILLPATQGGLILAMELYGIPTRKPNGKTIDVGMVGQGRLVGRPTSMVLMDRYMVTPELFNVDSDRVTERLHEKDLIITATGQPQFLGCEIINPDRKQWLLDMGIHQIGDKNCGDFKPELNDAAYAIMKTPGGAGSFTTFYLIHNMLLSAARRAREKDPEFDLYANDAP